MPRSTKLEAYLAGVPEERRPALRAVRDAIVRHLPAGYVESIGDRFVTYEVPLTVYPDTYNERPLMYAALGSQKGYMALYLCNTYGSSPLRKELEAGFRAAGKKLDMGKSCVRFKKLEDLPLDVVGRVVAATPMAAYVALAKEAHSKEAREARSAARTKAAPARKKPARPR